MKKISSLFPYLHKAEIVILPFKKEIGIGRFKFFTLL
jgi:hypothetical protein